MMRPILLMSCAALLATVPPASASCHWCVGDVVADCGALEAGGCAESAVHLGTHAPALLAELAEDPSGFTCAEAQDAAPMPLAFQSVRHWEAFGC